MKRDLISIKDLSVRQINELFVLAARLKQRQQKFSHLLEGKTIGLIFHKPSLRTRVSFEVGISQLGGDSLYLGDVSLSERESLKDVAKTLSRYLDAIVLRTFDHSTVIDLALHADIPVINGLSDLLHPCQVLSDLFTIKEKLGRLNGVVIAYVGDGNNVCHSLLYGCSKLGLKLNIATPQGYEPKRNIVDEAIRFAKDSDAEINLLREPKAAVKEADIIYTDVWASMGQEGEKEQRREVFSGYQINKELLKCAKDDVLIMHCLPAHRGEEITDEVIDSENSIVFDQAENRLHVQKAILIKFIGD